MTVRTLVVNADDFGHSEPVNDGILEAHERGIVTSASLMVRRPGADGAVAAAPASLAVGLHVELGEWTFRDGAWHGAGEVPPERVAAEVRSQLERFRELTGRDPTHLDSHQHVHREEPARSAAVELAAELGVPLREHDPRIRFLGGFYGQSDTGEPWHEGVGVEHLVALLRSLPRGVTELSCHPATAAPPATPYGVERVLELAALCDPRVRAALDEEDVALVSFAGL